MSEHELEKLLGGFAADTLTAEERERLYRTALHDQRLFDALADEQALKELLADPVVRTRLLEALRGASGLGHERHRAWLAWFRRPMNLALAGGLASFAIALVLGTAIYRDSLTRVARDGSAARDEGTARQPSVTGPSSQVERQPAPPAPGKDEPALATRPGAESKEGASRNRAPGSKTRRMDTAPSRSPDEVGGPPAQDQFSETRPGSAPGKSAPHSTEVQPAAPAAGSSAPSLSARSLFHRSSKSQLMADRLTTAREADEAEFTQPEKKRLQRTPNALGKLEAAGGRPLGVRYSLMINGPGGLDLEIDPVTAVGQDDRPRVAVQTTETGYLSIQVVHGDRTAILLALAQVAARTPVTIALAPVFEQLSDADHVRLSVLFTRREHDAGMASRPEAAQARLMIEQVSPETHSGPAEQALYAVDPRPESSHLLLEVPLNLRP